ncbi:hypothetical protein [Rubripirellula reticaptiva]|uniref:Desulfoferrodoxin N-terminal domain-containing protein n=1 Tax=Rubripirellula reticaptiva TaxID=2528013 RepID=A0A5C6EDW5_9BACT|nr:hypothetical protein [Rubripirellula reticaptiva]TWU46840.1 hypothetical protein Poly59_58130 [Rubripirellula reticaptiva]
MSETRKPLKIGDMFRCAKCGLEIHVTQGCDCKDCRADFQCCGQPLENVTAVTVRKAQSELN